MSRTKAIVGALTAAGKATDAPRLAKTVQVTLGKHFINIALMPHVKDQVVAGKIKIAHESHRQLDYPQIGGQMATGHVHTIHQVGADLREQLVKLIGRQSLEGFGCRAPM